MGRDPCKETIKNLHRILEDDPSDSLCKKIKEHLKLCPTCSGRYRDLGSLIALCNSFPAEQMPEDRKRLMKEELKKALFKR